MKGDCIKVLVERVIGVIRYGVDSDLYTIRINRKHLTAHYNIVGSIEVIVGDGMNPIIPGDRLELLRVETLNPPNPIFVLINTPFNGTNHSGQYIIDTENVREYEFNGEVEELYHFPVMEKAQYFDVKPILCYYDPNTKLKSYDVIHNNIAPLTDHPEELRWALFVRYQYESKCVGSWISQSHAWDVHTKFRAALQVINKLAES